MPVTVPGETPRACSSSPVATGVPPASPCAAIERNRLDVILDSQARHGPILSERGHEVRGNESCGFPSYDEAHRAEK